MTARAETDAIEYLSVILCGVSAAALAVVYVVWEPGPSATGWRQLIAALIPNAIPILLAAPVVYVLYSRRGISAMGRRDRELAHLVAQHLRGEDLAAPSKLLLAPARSPERWNCKWTVDDKTYPEQRLQDSIHLWSLADGRVLGFGENEVFGRYRLAGNGSRDTLALLYQGEGERSYLLGCILIKRSAEGPDADHLYGEWFQYPAVHSFSFIGGSVTLTRAHVSGPPGAADSARAEKAGSSAGH